MELVISRPGSTGDRYITARVSDTTSSTIVVADDGGIDAPVYAALNGQTQGFVVYDFHTGDNTTGGNWTDDPDYDGGLTVTGFTDENADFQSYMVGWTLIADVEKPSFLTIFAVPTATRVEVFGDATGLSADTRTYRLVAPPGVDPTTGALSKPGSVLSKRADNRGCGFLWSGYQYVPPQVGHESGGEIIDAQGGINKLGSYLCWNRVYDVHTGRWTTPDPAASPWSNLILYAWTIPVQLRDISGLTSVDWRVSETWDDAEAGSPEDTLWDAVKKHRKRWAKNWNDGKDDDGTSDVDTDVEEDAIVKAIGDTDDDDVYVYMGHTAVDEDKGKAVGLTSHDGGWAKGCAAAGAGCGLLGGLPGVVVGGGVGYLGGLVGEAIDENEQLDSDKYNAAAKKAKGVVIIFGCAACDLEHQFPNAKCFICLDGTKDTATLCATGAVNAFAKALDGLGDSSNPSWSDLVAKANSNITSGCPKLKASAGCANKKAFPDLGK